MSGSIPTRGDRFGLLSILEEAHNSSGGHRAYRCICVCGRIGVVQSSNLRSGHSKSCGCRGTKSNGTIAERLLARARWDGQCLVWIGGLVKGGYGGMRVAGRLHRTHVLAYEHFIGPVPHGHGVLHTCDKPPCITWWAHLFTGTDADNVRDRDVKGRMARGSKHPRARLTEDGVLIIRAQHKSGAMTTSELAKQRGVSRQCIDEVLNYSTWKHVP